MRRSIASIQLERGAISGSGNRVASAADIEMTRALERGEIPKENFHHASHLHVAWVYLTESSSPKKAADKMCDTLRRFTTAVGKPEKYHETMTLFWVHLLARAQTVSRTGRFEDVMHANPHLLEKNFPLAYYSTERLFSDEARASWMEPDLKPLSIDAPEICAPGTPCDPQNRSLS